MRLFLTSLVLVSLTALAAHAGQPDLGFRPSDEEGFYTFDTGFLRGTVRLNGRSQGITELVHAASGTELASGGRLPGLFSYYRVFSAKARYGNAARDWPTTTEILPDGALRVFWPAGGEHPLEMTAVHRWTRPDTLDVETTVKPLEDVPAFEVFVSSYYREAFLARVYVTPAGQPEASPRFVPADRNAASKGGYVMFPRDERALNMILDGRWKIPPNPVDWDLVRWLAAPLAVRQDPASGMTAVMMAPLEDCFAISSPYNPASPDARGYRSLYLSLFGRDVKAGESVRARCRLVVRQNLTDEQVVELYEAYLREAKSPLPHRTTSR